MLNAHGDFPVSISHVWFQARAWRFANLPASLGPGCTRSDPRRRSSCCAVPWAFWRPKERRSLARRKWRGHRWVPRSFFTAMGKTNGKYVINHINHLIIDIFCLHCASGCRAAVVGLLLDCCRLLLRLWLKLPTVEAASSRFLVICVIVKLLFLKPGDSKTIFWPRSGLVLGSFGIRDLKPTWGVQFYCDYIRQVGWGRASWGIRCFVWKRIRRDHFGQINWLQNLGSCCASSGASANQTEIPFQKHVWFMCSHCAFNSPSHTFWTFMLLWTLGSDTF